MKAVRQQHCLKRKELSFLRSSPTPLTLCGQQKPSDAESTEERKMETSGKGMGKGSDSFRHA